MGLSGPEDVSDSDQRATKRDEVVVVGLTSLSERSGRKHCKIFSSIYAAANTHKEHRLQCTKGTRNMA